MLRAAFAAVLAAAMLGTSAAALAAANHPPRITALSLTPAAPLRGSTETVKATASDPDHTRVTLRYAWLRDGKPIAGATGKSLVLATHGVRKGDKIAARVIATSGGQSVTKTSATVTVRDTAPHITSVAIAPSSPTTSDTLTATVATADADGDALTQQRTWTWSCPGAPAGSVVSQTFSVGGRGLHPGCRISLSDRVTDGQLSATTTAADVTVADRAPVIAAVQLSPADPTAAQTVSASAPMSDPDGDSVSTFCQWTLGLIPLDTAACSIDLAAVGATEGETLAVTLTATDGTRDVASSADTTIADAAPVVTAVQIDNQSPQTDDVLHAVVNAHDPDSDPITLAYQWQRNGVPIPGATGSSLDLSQAGNGDRGDGIAVTVNADDGTLQSAPATSGTVTVTDSAPVLATAEFSTLSPVAGESISVDPVSASDADGDPVTTAVTWSLNGQAFATGATVTVPAGSLRGDTLTAAITANDGTLTTTQSLDEPVADAPPVITSVAIDNQAPQTDDVVTAQTSTSDPDGDPVGLAYQWLLNGAPIPGADGPSLDVSQAGNGDKGDHLAVTVTADDGTAQTSATSSPVTITNTAPSLTGATIAYDPGTGTATVTPQASDADGDTLTTSVRWTINGLDAGTASTLDLTTAGAYLGDTIGARVHVTDTSNASSGWVDATPTTIDSGLPAAPPMNDWYPVNAPDWNAYVTSLLVNPADPQVLYEVDETLNISHDGGATWTRGQPCEALSVALDPSNPATVYEDCDDAGIYRSTDGGGSWSLDSPQTSDWTGTVDAIAVDSDSPQTLWAVGDIGTFDVERSTDGGQTWQGVHANNGIPVSVAVDPSNDQHVVVGTTKGVLVTTDGGATWSGPSGPGSMQAAFDPADPSHIWAIETKAATPSVLQSTDGGFTWATVGGSPTELTSLAVGSGVVYVGGNQGVWRTTDGGSTWANSYLVPSDSFGSWVTALAIDPSDARHVYVGYSQEGNIWSLEFRPGMQLGATHYNYVRVASVTDVTSTSATVTFDVSPLPGSTGWIGWQWGTTLRHSAGGGILLDGNVPVTYTTSMQQVTTTITGLTPGTTYNMQPVAIANGHIGSVAVAAPPVSFTTH